MPTATALVNARTPEMDDPAGKPASDTRHSCRPVASLIAVTVVPVPTMARPAPLAA